MKKFILQLLICLSLASPCHAGPEIFMGAAAAAAGCTTSNDGALIDNLTATDQGNTNALWATTSITLAANSHITRYYYKVSDKYGEGSITCSLSSSDPGTSYTEVTGSAVTVGYAAVDAAGGTPYSTVGTVEFVLTTPIAVTAGNYWMYCTSTAGGADFTIAFGAKSGFTWQNYAAGPYTNYSMAFKLMGCAP